VGIVREHHLAGDAPMLVADVSAARGVLGWSPAHSDLNTIVKPPRTGIRLRPRSCLWAGTEFVKRKSTIRKVHGRNVGAGRR